jgi:hypothetical protein
MKFSILIHGIALLMRLNLARHKFLRDMLSVKNHTIVMKTKDGRRGRRFILANGKFSTDKVLTEYDLAYVWKDADTAYEVLSSNDPTAMPKAQANWDLELEGDESISFWFSIFLGYATGVLKRS